MGWLTDKLLSSSIKSQRRELAEFLAVLSVMDPDEMAALVAIATHMRNNILERFGWDLLRPSVVNRGAPLAASTLSSAIRDSQREGRNLDASGLMVWLHTLRSADDTAMSILGRQMWRLLTLGFPGVVEVSLNFKELYGIEINVSGFVEIPEGFADTL